MNDDQVMTALLDPVPVLCMETTVRPSWPAATGCGSCTGADGASGGLSGGLPRPRRSRDASRQALPIAAPVSRWPHGKSRGNRAGWSR